ncbi:TPA: chorismate mutase [Legionella pneumophila subsp. pneumophila]|jgi:chorismate mutase|uniref:chorismate mutase n=3 Tax=Legionella pneumophila TaxID=446 RepID=A0A2S6EVV7_LEGPN|nr:chorismate mutase [Legionella pneumophila]AOW50993.1 chorismate mutase [Legionella pneumophila subsp. pneumophila]AOW55405.1 chorismate mutase [Legionella pneumophila subsp. pneumophila]AOW59044.1 chorismate mutase [Legionella pneumophila subsp. pneumophila]AOW60767.1 chorismate mutase [Legionella pneumophila subsp. pneumophila]AOW64500.1 chorismate mutase [Legionella pneumophila subsp. pneumophila]
MSTIEELRKQIEQTDAYIIEKLAQRQELSKQIGALKAKEGKKIIDRLREKKLFEYYDYLSRQYHLQQDFVNQLFKIIISNSKKVQK